MDLSLRINSSVVLLITTTYTFVHIFHKSSVKAFYQVFSYGIFNLSLLYGNYLPLFKGASTKLVASYILALLHSLWPSPSLFVLNFYYLVSKLPSGSLLTCLHKAFDLAHCLIIFLWHKSVTWQFSHLHEYAVLRIPSKPAHIHHTLHFGQSLQTHAEYALQCHVLTSPAIPYYDLHRSRKWFVFYFSSPSFPFPLHHLLCSSWLISAKQPPCL